MIEGEHRKLYSGRKDRRSSAVDPPHSAKQGTRVLECSSSALQSDCTREKEYRYCNHCQYRTGRK